MAWMAGASATVASRISTSVSRGADMLVLDHPQTIEGCGRPCRPEASPGKGVGAMIRGTVLAAGVALGLLGAGCGSPARHVAAPVVASPTPTVSPSAVVLTTPPTLSAVSFAHPWAGRPFSLPGHAGRSAGRRRSGDPARHRRCSVRGLDRGPRRPLAAFRRLLELGGGPLARSRWRNGRLR